MLYSALASNLLIVAAMVVSFHLGISPELDAAMYIVLNIALAFGYGALAFAVIEHQKLFEAKALLFLMLIYTSFGTLKLCQVFFLH